MEQFPATKVYSVDLHTGKSKVIHTKPKKTEPKKTTPQKSTSQKSISQKTDLPKNDTLQKAQPVKTANNSGILLKLFMIVIILLGLAILSYPFISNWLSQQRHQNLIGTYQTNINGLSPEANAVEWEKALAYNESMVGNPVKDPFLTGSGTAITGNYTKLLNVNGIMGYVDIPSINVHLPIYHGTSENVLHKGVGHLESTSLPTGGTGYNPVLSAHTGIPSSKLFSDLTKVKTGDIFSLRVLDKTLYYKVDDIKVILPEETENLTAVRGKDYATLLTCTPYGINSHRLVVRGARCYELSESLILAGQNTLLWLIVLIGSGLLFLVFLLLVIRGLHRLRRYPRSLRTKGVN